MDVALRCLRALYSALSSEEFSYQTCRPYNPRRDEDSVRQWKDDFKNVFTQVSQDHPSKEISVFFQDETRFGQKGTTSKQWAPVGKRPNRPVQDKYGNGHIFASCMSRFRSQAFFGEH
jgi:hypothetical protein